MKFLEAFILALKYRFHLIGLINTKFPHIWYNKHLKRYIVFCPECGEYICSDGICSNSFCPERLIDNE